MKFLNYTPHQINLLDVADGPIATYESECGMENLPRVEQSVEKVDTIDGINITRNTYGNVENLPEKVEGTMLIVSMMTMTAATDRDDLCYPNELVRNEKGHIIGCKSFAVK